jgi:bacterioferritin (cytochrome b1)
MEDENYRNFVVSRLNTSLEKKLSDESQHIEDVVSKILNLLGLPD